MVCTSTAPALPAPARLAPAWILGLLFALAGACRIPISYYDATTYQNLVELKVECSELVRSFDTQPQGVNREAIEELSIELRKAWEYEKGKGDDNSDTARQLKRILELFHEDAEDYLNSGLGDLGAGYFREAAAVLEQAFDVAIATENEKNRDKR